MSGTFARARVLTILALLVVPALRGPDALASGAGYQVRVLTTTGSHEIVVRVLVPSDGGTRVAETVFRANEVKRTGEYFPARTRSELTDSPIQGLHVNTFPVDVMGDGGAIVRSETMTVVVNFDRQGLVTFFHGTEDAGEGQGDRVARSLVWGYPPGIARDL